MYIEIIRTISEKLFYLTGGVAIANSIPFLLLYCLFLSLIILIPFIFVEKQKNKGILSIIGFVLFFPFLVFSMAPVFYQMQVMQECENIELLISTDKVTDQSLKMKHCRYKENYYEDFKDWKIYVN